ncbi:chemosensory receptor A [Elysia marginata]|uniref:Chemosensory receptor A n=1 Tax=Elysia marginata TaxID=1093978 RepID=A0AAV4HDG7_9GAST|nr:chemosensory receptor A [Elysia marginata]
MSQPSPWYIDENPSDIHSGNSSDYVYHTNVQPLLKFLEDLITSVSIAVCGFSSLANSINIVVFLKEGFQSTSNISFFALAIADLLISIILTGYMLSQHSVIETSNGPITNIITTYLIPCAESIDLIALWITTIITWERLFCIAFPLTVS